MAVDGTMDRLYFSQRAHEEREMAAKSEDNAAAKAHLDMADEYDRRAAESDDAS